MYLEIKSISITRLKQVANLAPDADSSKLEIKSISITRLKQIIKGLVADVRFTWNQKHLDYEIETCILTTNGCGFRIFTWNQKHLDYEIETDSD